MTNDLVYDIARLGYLAHRMDLELLGHPRREVDRALAAGTLLRVRPGWVATASASRLAVIAVLHGGRLTNASALASYGVWNGIDRRIHLAMPPTSHRVAVPARTPLERFAAPRFQAGVIARHWAAERLPVRPGEPRWRTSATDSLLSFAAAESPEQLAASIESAIHTRVLSRTELARLFSLLPRRLKSLQRELDFTAESGLETIARLRLSKLVDRIESQVTVSGVGRVDLLVDRWLVIELNGDEFHDPVSDRKRAADLIRAGYLPVMFGYRQVLYEWGECVEVIQRLLKTR